MKWSTKRNKTQTNDHKGVGPVAMIEWPKI